MAAYLKEGKIIEIGFDVLSDIPEGTEVIDFDHGIKAPSNMTDEEAEKLIQQWRLDQKGKP